MEGIIYILTNRAMPDYIKIGLTTREDIRTRINELNTTGVPFPFVLYYAVKVSNAKSTESMIHQMFSIHRENMSREFFRMEPERAIYALKLTGGQEIKIENSEIYSQEDIEIVEKPRKTIAPRFFFSMLDIQANEELTFIRDENIKCKALANDISFNGNKVEFEGEEYSLSSLAAKLLGKENSNGVQGPKFWLYKGKTLSELHNEKKQEISEE